VSTWEWVVAGVALVVLVLFVGGLFLWKVLHPAADDAEHALRATRYVGTILLAGALISGGVVIAYGVTALDELSPSEAPTSTTTKTTTVTESDPKKTETREETTAPSADATDQTSILGALLAFTFGLGQ
jgi:hypothetical protein